MEMQKARSEETLKLQKATVSGQGFTGRHKPSYGQGRVTEGFLVQPLRR